MIWEIHTQHWIIYRNSARSIHHRQQTGFTRQRRHFSAVTLVFLCICGVVVTLWLVFKFISVFVFGFLEEKKIKQTSFAIALITVICSFCSFISNEPWPSLCEHPCLAHNRINIFQILGFLHLHCFYFHTAYCCLGPALALLLSEIRSMEKSEEGIAQVCCDPHACVYAA